MQTSGSDENLFTSRFPVSFPPVSITENNANLLKLITFSWIFSQEIIGNVMELK